MSITVVRNIPTFNLTVSDIIIGTVYQDMSENLYLGVHPIIDRDFDEGERVVLAVCISGVAEAICVGSKVRLREVDIEIRVLN